MISRSQSSIKILVIILVLSGCMVFKGQSQSQPPSITDYGAKFTVKPGDSMQYRYTKVYSHGLNYFNSSVIFANGTFTQIKITQDTLITLNVTNVSDSVVRGNVTFYVPGSQTLYYNSILFLSFVIQSFDNESIVNKFLKDLYDSNSNPNSNSNSNIEYRTDSTYLYLSSVYSNPPSSNDASSNTKITSKIVANWHTGWIKSRESTTNFLNGTIYSATSIEQVSSTDPLENIINTGFNIIIYAIPVGLLAIVVFAFISYKKESKLNLDRTDRPSFLQYASKDFKKKNKVSTKDPVKIEKSLEIIDEILRETENS